PDALYNLGVAYMEQGEAERARACFDRILQSDPSNVDARERLAAAYLTVGRYVEALDHIQEVVRARPADAAAHAALANACFQLGRLDEARIAAQKVIQLDFAATGGYSMLALIQNVSGELDQSLATLQEGYARTSADLLLGSLVHVSHRMCDWETWRPHWNRLEARLATSSDAGSPFWLLCEDTTAEQQLSYTRRWAAERFANVRTPVVKRAARGDRRLRIGYFSPDFHEHATSYLLAEVLELHDRERFDVFAYSYGPEDGSPMRARVRAAVEHFVDVAWEPHDLLVERMTRDELDVLVDLKGYLVGDRLEVMARRPGAVQVAWLGYPGTTGTDFIDYLIADEYVIPRGAEAFYSEKILRMPQCYQPNDRRRPRPPARPREEYGLARDAFVFCCFNQTVKIIPEVFARWMSLLRKVPGSVLWLLDDNARASANLKRCAEELGIAPGRIVIAGRVPLAEHLARYGAADLALDTFPYTSHTTASDALWLGCPLVGLSGGTFASRVSGSVLASCGLAELVTGNLDDYEALAYRLATDAAYMQDIRSRLAAARDTAPLFDAAQFTRDLERLYRQITQ
ncbi:MAG TPA: tetratricopeptide repeat protein, partial [Burkholderiales bacterium]|nr:tetratricopeptide repeat protein [Burkholderiales bacterium]